jgi:hypothetical protein
MTLIVSQRDIELAIRAERATRNDVIKNPEIRAETLALFFAMARQEGQEEGIKEALLEMSVT